MIFHSEGLQRYTCSLQTNHNNDCCTETALLFHYVVKSFHLTVNKSVVVLKGCQCNESRLKFPENDQAGKKGTQ